MPVVAAVDYAAKRIYLHPSTVNTVLDTLDVYREVRALRRATEAHRRFQPMVVAGGNIEKIPGISYTAPYVQLLSGCRIVPHDSSHRLTVIRDTFTDAGESGRDCFDRSTLGPGTDVDIDVQVDKVEIRVVATGSGLSPAQDAALSSIKTRVDALPSASEIAQAVWAAEVDAYILSGTMGKELAAAISQVADVYQVSYGRLETNLEVGKLRLYNPAGVLTHEGHIYNDTDGVEHADGTSAILRRDALLPVT